MLIQMIQSSLLKNDRAVLYSMTAASVIMSTIFFSSNRVKKLIQCHIQRIQLMLLANASSNDNVSSSSTSSSSPPSSKASSSSTATENNNEQQKVTVSGIFIHPVKSLRPVSVNSSTFTNLGLEGDRTLMIVRPIPSSASSSATSATHRFLTQRQCPQFATIDASLPTQIHKHSNQKKHKDDKLVIQLSHASQSQKVFIDISPKALKSYPVQYHAGVWSDVVEVVDVGDEAASFIQAVLQTSDHNTNDNDDADDNDITYDSYDDVRVVSIIPNVTDRKTDETYVPLPAHVVHNLGFKTAPPQVALSDGFPILITSQESLDELNTRLKNKKKDVLPMSRFRPNIVVKGLQKAFDEDEWKAIQIGGKNGAMFHIVKGCPRCKQSCTDQVTGERDVEPLETLSDFRSLGAYDDVYFGQNVVLQPMSMTTRSFPSIHVGDEVKILTRGDPIWDDEEVEAE